ncbi:MAG TPA: hypothetical protein DCG38_03950 [Eubacteriaceae bacterium]|nr:hypothetical protein [Eubacteriaceae bacterium]
MNLKKTVTLLMVLLLIVGSSASVFAATEDDIIQALRDAKVPETYIIQAENYLKENDVASEDASAIIAKIEDSKAILDAAGVTNVTELSDADKQELLDNVRSAGEVLDLTFTISASNGSYDVVVTDAEGAVVTEFKSNQVNQTGANPIMFVGGFALISAAAAFLMINRKKVAA